MMGYIIENLQNSLDTGILALKTAWESEILKEFGNKMWIPELDDEYKPWFFNPHGICHAYSVKRNSVKLYKKYISTLHTDPMSYRVEKLILEISALSHDLSMISPDIKKWNSPDGFKELRKKHGEYSYQIVKNMEKAILKFDYEEGSNQVFSLDLGDFIGIVGFLIKNHNGKKHIKKNKLKQRVLSVYIKEKEYQVTIRPYLLLPILRTADLIDDNYERFNPKYTPSRKIQENPCLAESEGYLKILNKAIAWGYVFGSTFAEQIKFYLRSMIIRENPLDNIGTGYSKNNKTFLMSLPLFNFPSKVVFYPERDWRITITQETVERWLRDYLNLEIDEVASSRINGYSNRILKEFGLPLMKYQLEYTEMDFPIEEVFKMTYIRNAIQFLLRKLESNDISSLITTTYRLTNLHSITIPEIIVPYKIENEPTHYALLINKNTTNQADHPYKLSPSLTSSVRSVIQQPMEQLVEFYTDFELIGQGGFAWVYKAKRKSDGKTVALKIPKNLDTATGKAFLREISNWLHLKHPNIVELYDANVLPIPYLEMEFCEGSLEKTKRPMSIDEAVLVILNIAEGLKYAHSKGVIHRDLKPSNVLLKQGIAKISDWGLSKFVSENTYSTLEITPLYAAPEQIDPSRFGKTDERTDIWQLGVIFYELVTGRSPFNGSTFGEIVFSIIGKDPVPPSAVNPEAKFVEPIIMKMLAKDKAKRYETVEQLQNDLLKVFMEILPTNTELTTVTKNIRLVEYFKYMFIAYLRAGNLENAYRIGTELKLYINDSTKLKKLHKMLSQLSVFLNERITPSPETINNIEETIIWLV